jgi:hypothetical protein
MAHVSDASCVQTLITVSCACPSWATFTKVMNGNIFSPPNSVATSRQPCELYPTEYPLVEAMAISAFKAAQCVASHQRPSAMIQV